MKHAAAIFLVALLHSVAVAQDRAPAQKVTFTERSPLSAIPALSQRIGWSMKAIEQMGREGKDTDYHLKNESFLLHVPDQYDGKEPWGLFVWVNAGGSGQFPSSWLEVLAKHKLIAVGANNSGNNRAPWVRLGLALDAVHNLSRQYKIDPHRVFIAGGSGGGRCASMLGVAFPDVFEGGFYLIGCNYYRKMGPDGGRGGYWGPGYVKPAPKLFALATRRSRHVLLTGDRDGNREQTHVYYGGFVQDGFRHVTYIEIEDFGHQLPGNEWFEKGLTLLEPKQEEPAKVAAAKVPPPAAKAPPAPRVPAAEPSEADKLLSMAKLYITNRRYDGARSRLKKLVESYPDSVAAIEGKRLLKEIGGK